MLGISKKVESVRTALYDALTARAKELHDKHLTSQCPNEFPLLRALVLLDLADVIRKLAVNVKED